jgi:hypothetical protein
MAITFDETIESRLNFLHEFPDAVFLGVDMVSQIDDEGIWSPKLSIRPLDHPQIFEHVSGRRFPWDFYVIATRRRGGLVSQT